jgi:hypothetical protein
MLRARPVLAVLTAAILGTGSPAFGQTVVAWTQLTGQGAEARAVVDGGACPQATIDGRSAAMAVRAPAAAGFPMICALAIPQGATSVSIGGQALPVPAPPKRIVVFGDTGCRVKGLAIQACNDANAWPFAEIARLAAAQKPDLVIHVGDYYYRESPCPLGLRACAGSPSGDNWGTWAAEFFDPAMPLLAAAPWVFARGNHETCDRGGGGWYRLLDASPLPEGCPKFTAPFVARAGDLGLYVIDSGDIPDRSHDPKDVSAVSGQLDKLGPALDLDHGWIVTHRPVWGLVPVARIGPSAPFEVGLNFTEQDAVRGRALAGVQLVLSGHVHHFQAIDFGPARPAQLVVGSGGDLGEGADLARAYSERREIDGLNAGAFSFSRFGYFVMDRDGEDWVGTFHDATDRVRARCRLHQRDLKCADVK